MDKYIHTHCVCTITIIYTLYVFVERPCACWNSLVSHSAVCGVVLVREDSPDSGGLAQDSPALDRMSAN